MCRNWHPRKRSGPHHLLLFLACGYCLSFTTLFLLHPFGNQHLSVAISLLPCFLFSFFGKTLEYFESCSISQALFAALGAERLQQRPCQIFLWFHVPRDGKTRRPNCCNTETCCEWKTSRALEKAVTAVAHVGWQKKLRSPLLDSDCLDLIKNCTKMGISAVPNDRCLCRRRLLLTLVFSVDGEMNAFSCWTCFVTSRYLQLVKHSSSLECLENQSLDSHPAWMLAHAAKVVAVAVTAADVATWCGVA